MLTNNIEYHKQDREREREGVRQREEEKINRAKVRKREEKTIKKERQKEKERVTTQDLKRKETSIKIYFESEDFLLKIVKKEISSYY